MQSASQIIQHIHVVNKRIIRRVVGGEVFVDVAVGEVFGAHVVEVVACCEFAPVVQEVPGVVALFLVASNHRGLVGSFDGAF